MNLLGSVSWFTPTWDLFIILFLIVATFLLGLILGRNKILVFLISIYMTVAVVNFFPFGDIFKLPKNDENFVYPIAVFITVVILIFLLLSNSALKKAFSERRNRSIILIFPFSLFCIGLILSTVLSFFPKDLVETFNPITQKLFMAEFSRFLWAIVPIVSMALTRKRMGRREFY